MVAKTNKTEEGFIKIPTDFKSLHDLKDLVNYYDLVSRLSNLLDNYQKAHIDSYLMTMDEVLEYIPIRHHDEYKVTIGGNVIDSVYISYENVKNDLISKLTYVLSEQRYLKGGKYVSVVEYDGDGYDEYDIIPVKNYKEQKIFIVNTLKKQIDCIYFFSKLSFYKKPHKYGKIEYKINKEKILSVKVHFSFTANQQVGGSRIWCAKGHTYFRGGNRVPYERNAYEIYLFDTKTNQYLGYGGSKITTPERKWQQSCY